MNEKLMLAYPIFILLVFFVCAGNRHKVRDPLDFISMVSGIGIFVWFLWSVFEVVFN